MDAVVTAVVAVVVVGVDVASTDKYTQIIKSLEISYFLRNLHLSRVGICRF